MQRTNMTNQKLFDYMLNEHGVTLLVGDMHEIETIVNKALKAENEQLKEEMKHARKFITSREKMHPDGIALYDELLKSE